MPPGGRGRDGGRGCHSSTAVCCNAVAQLLSPSTPAATCPQTVRHLSASGCGAAGLWGHTLHTNKTINTRLMDHARGGGGGGDGGRGGGRGAGGGGGGGGGGEEGPPHAAPSALARLPVSHPNPRLRSGMVGDEQPLSSVSTPPPPPRLIDLTTPPGPYVCIMRPKLDHRCVFLWAVRTPRLQTHFRAIRDQNLALVCMCIVKQDSTCVCPQVALMGADAYTMDEIWSSSAS